MDSAAVGVTGEESDLVARLSLEQKVRLLTGATAWVLYDESAVGLRSIVMSDGPAGVRGLSLDPANPSTSLPCPVALGATWDPDLIEELAIALGREARSKGVDVILAPTINIIRTPLSGRGFECFSEDPLLTSRIAVAYVRGVQKAGVAATAKHYVANDSETERRTYDARISESVLRELYLAPFEAAVVEAGTMLVMAAYNSVDGATMTANAPLLRGVLKGEWEFPGVVVSDWSATTSTAASAIGGLDLVMPGPSGPWGAKLIAAVREGRVPESDVDDKVARLLTLAGWLGALDDSANGGGHGAIAGPHAALIAPEMVRAAATRSFVLLKNERGLLPIAPGSVTRVALIGPNAVEPSLQGGGSIRVLGVTPTPLPQAIADALDAQVSVEQGSLTGATVALPAPGTISDPAGGKSGIHLQILDAEGAVLYDAHRTTSVVGWWDQVPNEAHLHGAEFVMRARYMPQIDGLHVIGAAGVGRARIFVGDALAAEATSLQPRDIVEALSKPAELRVPVQMRAGQEVDVRMEFEPAGRFVTTRLGIAPHREDDALIEQAVKAAAAADVAVVVVGSPDGTESEGFDREGLALAGTQDELVRRVAAANPNTVVVVNSGMPVLMPWIDDVSAVVQAWLPGQAFSEALGEILSGDAEPGGRLPVSIPRTEADSPVLHARPDNGVLAYSEGLLVGYRGFDRSGKEPLFCFGHGLGYSTWTYDSMELAAAELIDEEGLDVAINLRNSGTRPGREVVQIYVEGPDDDPSRPIRWLGGFVSVLADAGERVTARVSVPARAFMRYEGGSRGWAVHPGTYTIHAGRSSRDLKLKENVAVR